MVTETISYLAKKNGGQERDSKFIRNTIPGKVGILNPAALQHIFFLLFCLVITSAACKKESTSPPQPFGVSSLSFTYSGDQNGTYSAIGEYQSPPTTEPWTYEWAGARRFTNLLVKYIFIGANAEVTANPYVSEYFYIHIPDKGKGTFPIPTWGSEEIIFNYTGGLAPDEHYNVSAGTVVVTTYSKDRVAGTFTATARDQFDGSKHVNITNGQFDLKLTGP
ncbi:hypothetical protein BH10BAC3_BH10BAC3_13640 [soil metagenome]